MRLAAVTLWFFAAAAHAAGEPPEFPAVWTNLGEAARFHIEETEYALKQGALDTASLELQQALSIVPDNPTLLRWAADLYTERGQYAMAESYWARLSEVFPSNAWISSRWGDVLARMGRYTLAEEPLALALSQDPSDLTTRYHLACTYLAQGNPDAARDLLACLNLAERSQLAGRIAGEWRALISLMGFEPARALCRLTLGWPATEASAPGSEPPPDIWLSRMELMAEELPAARQALDARDWTRARGHLDTLRAMGFKDPEFQRDYALTLYRLQEKEWALRELADLSATHPDQPGIKEIHGVLLLEERRFPEAVEMLEAGYARNSSSTETAFALISAYAASERYTDARDVARTLAPGPAADIARRLREGHPYREFLKGNPDLLEWLESRDPAAPAP